MKVECSPTGKIVKHVAWQPFEINADVQADIVELWSNHTGRFRAHPLKKKGENWKITIRPRSSQRFHYAVRARNNEDDHWTWNTGKIMQLTEAHVEPAWIESAIVYNAFVRFFGAKDRNNDGRVEPGEGGTFDDVKVELKRIKALGANVLYLNPIHPIGEVYRNYNPHDLLPSYLQPGCPYSIKDYKSIDPELARDWDNEETGAKYTDPLSEFKELVDHAHAMGIRVIMDLVFNHTAHDAVFQRMHPEWYLYREDPNSAESPYIYPEEKGKGKPWGDSKHTASAWDKGYLWGDVAQLNWEHAILCSPNEPPKNPHKREMYEYFKSIVKYWIKNFGIDGFRCDVAYRVPPDFWKECILEAQEFARESHPKNGSLGPDCVFIAESYADELTELLEAGFTSCYGDFSNKLYNPEQLKGYTDYMYNLSGKHFPDGTRWFLFPECHDFHRAPMKHAALYKNHPHGDVLANQSRWVLTACLPGIPMIFNGYEKVEWKPVNLFSYSTIDWENKKDISEYLRWVNHVRLNSKALQEGSYVPVSTSQGWKQDSQAYCFARIASEEKIIVCTNMDLAHPAYFTLHVPTELSLNPEKKYNFHDLLDGNTYERSGKEFEVVLKPGQSHIFVVKEKKA